MSDQSAYEELVWESVGAAGAGLRGSPASSAEIAAAEERLNSKFPSEYRSFLASFGWFEGGCLDILGVGESIDQSLDVVGVTLWERSVPAVRLPTFLVAIAPDGAGNFYCFDSRFIGEENESAVYFFDHEHEAGTAQEVACEAPSFFEWVVMSVIRPGMA